MYMSYSKVQSTGMSLFIGLTGMSLFIGLKGMSLFSGLTGMSLFIGLTGRSIIHHNNRKEVRSVLPYANLACFSSIITFSYI